MDTRLKKFPLEFINRTQKIFPQGMLHSVWKAYLNPRCHTLRVNTIKSSDENVVKYFYQEKIEIEKEQSLPNCFHIKNLSLKKLRNLPIYQSGAIYLQNISSQLPPLILNPQSGERVLDLCASPGSKTTQMAAMMNNKGTLVALEPEKIRFERLLHNIQKSGCTNILPHQLRGETFCKHQLQTDQQKFDKILVDAPCSGDGTFYVNDQSGFHHWSLDFIHNVAKIQIKLLRSAIKVTRPGGFILYSTCSTAPEENEMVMAEMIKEQARLKIISLKNIVPSNFFKPALSNWGDLQFSKDILGSCRIYPSPRCQGFYLCLMQVESGHSNTSH